MIDQPTKHACEICSTIAMWRINKQGYWANSKYACHEHVGEIIDEWLIDSWADYPCSVRRIPGTIP